MTSNTIFEKLKGEHKEIKRLLNKALECETNMRSTVLEKIEEHLIPHARAEENTLYALIHDRAQEMNKDESTELIHEAYEEHRVNDELLRTLKNVDTSDEKWLAHLKVAKENILHHIEEEEDELFDTAKKLLSKEDQRELLNSYLIEKEKFTINLHAYSQIRDNTASGSANQTLH